MVGRTPHRAAGEALNRRRWEMMEQAEVTAKKVKELADAIRLLSDEDIPQYFQEETVSAL